MLDEPSAGLAPAIVIEVFDVVSRLRDQGIGVLLVEQLADRALAIADDVIVLDIGRVILRHDTAEGRNPAVLEAEPISASSRQASRSGLPGHRRCRQS